MKAPATAAFWLSRAPSSARRMEVRWSAFEEVRVDLSVLLPLVRHIAVLADGAHGANRLTCPAFDADVRIDEILLIFIRRVNAIHGACFDARGVLDPDA